MGKNTIPFCIFILAIAGMLWCIIYGIHHALNWNKSDDFIEDAPLDKEEYATIIDKATGIEQTGTAQYPEHILEFAVKFRYDNGEEISFNMPQEIFDKIIVGMRDTLITQNSNFVDFGGLDGENIR